MRDSSRQKQTLLRLVPLLGIGLLAYLVSKLDLHALRANVHAIRLGLLLIIALGGVSHVVKTCAWLLTMRSESRKVSFIRAFGLRLASEAIGQLGFLGMVGGETTRVSLLGSSVSLPVAISSATLDRGIFILTGAFVTLAGIAGIGFAAPLPHALRIYAAAVVIALLCLVAAGAIAIQRRWPVLSGSARAVAWIPRLNKWLASRESTLIASERRIAAFYHDSPGAFWWSVLLNLCCHFLAIVEVYICLRMLGAHATLTGALILEAMTKLVNVAGSVNPGNVGTYEAGEHGNWQARPADGSPGPAARVVPPCPSGVLGHHWWHMPCKALEKPEAPRGGTQSRKRTRVQQPSRTSALSTPSLYVRRCLFSLTIFLTR